MIENAKNNKGVYLISAKILTLLKSNVNLANQGKVFKSLLVGNVKMITFAMILCDILGFGVDSQDYSRKIMMITSLMTILGSGLWAGKRQEGRKYVVPDASNV